MSSGSFERKHLRGFPRDFPRSECAHMRVTSGHTSRARRYLPLVIVIVLCMCLSLRAPLRERVGSGDRDTLSRTQCCSMLNINMVILIVEPKYTVLQLLIMSYCYDNFVFSCTDHRLHHHLAAVPLGDLPHHLLHPVAERTVGI